MTHKKTYLMPDKKPDHLILTRKRKFELEEDTTREDKKASRMSGDKNAGQRGEIRKIPSQFYNIFHSSNSRREAGDPGPQLASHPEGVGGLRHAPQSPQRGGGDTSANLKLNVTEAVIGEREDAVTGSANQLLATTQLGSTVQGLKTIFWNGPAP